MIKLGKTVTVAVAMTALLAALAGCEKNEGPMERAGKDVDNAAATVGEKIEKAGENVQDAARGDGDKK
jgi:predicted small secreted protein